MGMAVAVAARSRAGGGGVRRHDQWRLGGREQLARDARALRITCGSNTLFVYIEESYCGPSTLFAYFLPRAPPTPVFATFLRQDAGNGGLCPSLTKRLIFILDLVRPHSTILDRSSISRDPIARSGWGTLCALCQNVIRCKRAWCANPK